MLLNWKVRDSGRWLGPTNIISRLRRTHTKNLWKGFSEKFHFHVFPIIFWKMCKLLKFLVCSKMGRQSASNTFQQRSRTMNASQFYHYFDFWKDSVQPPPIFSKLLQLYSLRILIGKNIHFFSREVSFWRSLVINPSITANSDRPDTYDQLPTGGYPGKNRMFEIFQFYSITMGYKNKARLSRNSSKMVLDVLKCAKNVWESALRFIRLLIGSYLTFWLYFSNFIGIPWILN